LDGMAADTPNAAEASLSRQVTHSRLTPRPSLVGVHPVSLQKAIENAVLHFSDVASYAI